MERCIGAYVSRSSSLPPPPALLLAKKKINISQSLTSHPPSLQPTRRHDRLQQRSQRHGRHSRRIPRARAPRYMGEELGISRVVRVYQLCARGRDVGAEIRGEEVAAIGGVEAEMGSERGV